MSLLDVKMLTA